MKKVLWIAGILFGLLAVITIISTVNQKTIKTEKTVKNDEITNIKIKGDVGDITVVKGNGDTFSIEQVSNSKKQTLDVEEKGDTLVIDSKIKKFFSFDLSLGAMKTPKLQVTVPARVYHDVTISVSVGDIKIEDIEGATIAVKTRTGDIQATKVTATDIELTSTTGDVDAQQIIGDIKAKTVTGDVTTVSKENNKNIEVSSSVGDIRITVPQEPKDARVKGKTTVGDIKLFGKNENELSFGNGTYKISGKITTGDITIDAKE